MKLYTLLLYIVVLTLTACANPGSGPDGGPYDETPPTIVEMIPNLGNNNEKARKVSIVFNELIKVEDAQEKIIVSPPQIEMPEIKVSGHKISVELIDTLKSNTTYTIDFSDAIVDCNEGNPLGNFTYYFATGERVDTMEVAGYVLAADNLEPVKGILVGLHSEAADSVFSLRPFERVARTDAFGHFSVKGVSPGKYRIYALKDIDNDFKFSRGEMLAFSSDTIIPRSFMDIHRDTLWADTVHIDTIKTVPYTHYLPDDVTLLAFTERNTVRQLLKTQREPEYFRLIFTAGSKSLPRLRGLNFDERNAWIEEHSINNDTLTYWLRNRELINQDSLIVACTYEATNDSTQAVYLQTDTLDLVPRILFARREKLREVELEKWQKELAKRHRRGDFSQETPPIEPLTVEYSAPSRMAPDQNVRFKLSEPAVRVDTTAIHLYLKVDSVYVEAPFRLERDSVSLLDYKIRAAWRPGQAYVLNVDSASIEGLSGKVNPTFDARLEIPAVEKYGSLFLVIPDAPPTAFVQLLSKDEAVIKQQPVVDGRADLFYINPATVYVRLIADSNQNGRWDTGVYAEGVQPERVYYFPQSFAIRANWDIEQVWRLNETPLYEQKPRELVKQKQTKQRTPKSRNAEREKAKQSNQ